MKTRRQRLDAALCLAVGIFYLVNRLWLRDVVSGWLGWFLGCYANDTAAGLAMVAWLDLLLELGGRSSIRWPLALPYLLLCGFVWEVLAPLWKVGAVFDPWDFAAYLAGGALYFLLATIQIKAK